MTFIDCSKPFVKRFVHDGLFYVYDVNTNRIVEVEKPVYDIIGDFDESNIHQIENRFKEIYPLSKIRKTIAQIKEAKKEHKLFSNFRPLKVVLGPGKVEPLKELHNKYGMQLLLLEVTKDCNLNCSYCSVSGKYANTTVRRRNMSMETAIKAVDFFCPRCHESREVNIGFYGGEPLLRFDLMKDTVQYVIKKYGAEKYKFNLTTNGTIFDEDIIDFFSRHDFQVLVSLDGPKCVTDRYRLSRDGKSTFDKIMRNLEFIKHYNYDFFSKNISINSVLTPPFQLHEIVDFFKNNGTVRDIQRKGKVRSNLVNTSDTKFLEDFCLKEDMNRYSDIFDGLVKNLKKLILERRLNEVTIEKSTIMDILYNLARRQVKGLCDCIPPMGACYIGLRRLFVTIDGDFNICERVQFDHTIGSIHTGFNYENMVTLYRKFDEILKDCKDCWALHHCERCWAAFKDIANLDKNVKDAFCRDRKDVIMIAFKAYVELLQQDPDSLKVLEKLDKENDNN